MKNKEIKIKIEDIDEADIEKEFKNKRIVGFIDFNAIPEFITIQEMSEVFGKLGFKWFIKTTSKKDLVLVVLFKEK